MFCTWCQPRCGKTLAVLGGSPLVGHYGTKSGPKIHPEKVRAVLEMPHPTDVKSSLYFNGTVQYLAKFSPGLSDMAHPLRQLTRKDAKWVWSETQEKAWSDIKTAISRAPVLRFYSLQDEVTLQCDTSDTGLGAILLQLQQPLRCCSKASTDAIASSTLQSQGQVQEGSPHAHRGHTQPRISQGHVAFRGSEIS